MTETDSTHSLDRSRIGWWVFVLALTVVAGSSPYSFVGMVVPGIFGYYATRPIDRRIETVVDSGGALGPLTVLVVLVPLVAVLFYAGFRIFTQARDTLGGATAFGALEDGSGYFQRREFVVDRAALENPGPNSPQIPRGPPRRYCRRGWRGSVSPLRRAVARRSGADAVVLPAGERPRTGGRFRQLAGGRDTTAYAYAAAVDGTWSRSSSATSSSSCSWPSSRRSSTR